MNKYYKYSSPSVIWIPGNPDSFGPTIAPLSDLFMVQITGGCRTSLCLTLTTLVK